MSLSGRDAPPSVLLITVDTLRPDRLGCYGHPTNRTPAIDRLAHEGALFEHAYCDTPWTTASMSSVMTGLLPNAHGLRLPINKLPPTALTMAELLQVNGYQTGAIIGSFPLDSVYGLDQGFETYDDQFSQPMIAVAGAPIEHMESQLPEDQTAQADFIRKKWQNDAYRPDEDVTSAAIAWLEGRRAEQRFLLWVHYFGPHEKLRGDVSFVEQEPDIVKVYDADVEASDRAVGRLLDHLRATDMLDRTLVILHADHGQNLGEENYVGHSIRLDEPSVRIPMIVRYPKRVPAGTRSASLVRNIDILPTVLGEARIGGVRGLAGRSLFAVGPSAAPTDVAYFETYVPTIVYEPLTKPGIGTLLGPVERHGVRTPLWKMVEHRFTGPCSWGAAPTRDPFGAWTVRDPKPLDASRCAELGRTDLYAASWGGPFGLAIAPDQPPDVVKYLHTQIREHADRVGADTGEGTFSLSPEQEQKLKSLGYLQ